ncbi:MAG: DMT family transporter [Phycisphaerales bacterium]
MTTGQWLLVLVAVITGMFIPLQPGINAELRLHAGSALTAALVSFAGGTLLLAALVLWVRLVQQPELPPVRTWVTTAPWWAYFGGLIGAMFVTVSLILAPKLGAAVLVAGIVTGQLIGSIVIDHLGAVGFPRISVTWPRVLGVGLLVAGVLVMQLGRGDAAAVP